MTVVYDDVALVCSKGDLQSHLHTTIGRSRYRVAEYRIYPFASPSYTMETVQLNSCASLLDGAHLENCDTTGEQNRINRSSAKAAVQ